MSAVFYMSNELMLEIAGSLKAVMGHVDLEVYSYDTCRSLQQANWAPLLASRLSSVGHGKRRSSLKQGGKMHSNHFHFNNIQ